MAKRARIAFACAPVCLMWSACADPADESKGAALGLAFTGEFVVEGTGQQGTAPFDIQNVAVVSDSTLVFNDRSGQRVRF